MGSAFLAYSHTHHRCCDCVSFFSLLRQENIVKEFEFSSVILSFLIIGGAIVAIVGTFAISVYSVVSMLQIGLMVNGIGSLALFVYYLLLSLILFLALSYN